MMRRNPPQACLAAAIALLLCSQAAFAQRAADWSIEDAAHLLRRAGFSGTPEQITRLHALGKKNAVAYMLDGTLPKAAAGLTAPFEPADMPEYQTLRELTGLNIGRGAYQFGQLPEEQRMALIGVFTAIQGFETQRLRGWWMHRMAVSHHPLREKMTLFWHGLFTSGGREVRNAEFLAVQNRVFYQHALGSYKDLTKAICKDPAMLRYLNADQNRRGMANENLARELFELFTLGEGNYTEQDIRETARALTGGGVDDRGYVFRERQHDSGIKRVFGKTGNFKSDDIVELIFQRREPADYLARRLWTHFAYPDPESTTISPVARALRKNWQLRDALEAIFLSDDFYSEKARFALIKSPVELLVSAAREMGHQPTPEALFAFNDNLRNMGQELFNPPNVRGWPGAELWITNTTLYARYELASSLVNGALQRARSLRLAARNVRLDRAFAIPDNATPALKEQLQSIRANVEKVRAMAEVAAGKADLPPAPVTQLLAPFPAQQIAPPDLLDSLIAHFLQRPLHPAKRQAILDAVGNAPIQRDHRPSDQRIRQMLALLLSSPEYQVH